MNIRNGYSTVTGILFFGSLTMLCRYFDYLSCTVGPWQVIVQSVKKTPQQPEIHETSWGNN